MPPEIYVGYFPKIPILLEDGYPVTQRTEFPLMIHLHCDAPVFHTPPLALDSIPDFSPLPLSLIGTPALRFYDPIPLSRPSGFP